MDASRRAGLTWGVLLILAGLIFLAAQVVPAMFGWVGDLSWPLFVIGAGLVLLLIGIASNQPGMTVPACIVGGIGGILYWQNTTGNWESWAWIWAMIPGFAGIGTIVMGLWEGKLGVALGGVWTILVSLVLTVVFASFLGGPRLLGQYWHYWPVLLIVLGLISLAQYFIRPRQPALRSGGDHAEQ
jgi:hypothetical protein